MSSKRRRRRDRSKPHQVSRDGWAPVPILVAPNGDKMVTVMDDKGELYTFLTAELSLMVSDRCTRPPGHVIRFKDGNRQNCDLANLEWVPSEHSDPGNAA